MSRYPAFGPSVPARTFVAFLTIIWLSCSFSDSFAQRPSTSRYSLAVDEVALTNGKKMYGIVVQQDPNSGLTLMVERAWFEKTYPQRYASHLEAERQSEIAAQTKHLFRLEAWWKSRINDRELVKFIDQEMERIEKERDAQKAIDNADGKPLKPFTWAHYPTNEVANVHVQSPAVHRIAGLAWQHNVARVTTRSVTSIQRELEQLKIDTNNETFDLSSQLPGSREQSDIEWNARVALIEFKLRSRLEFQGVGTNLIRVDPDKPAGQQVDIQSLIKQFMTSGLGGGSDVDDLLKELGLGGAGKPEQQWWKRAAEIAESEKFSGFLVTRIVQNGSGPMATVEHCFFAQVEPGQWKQIASLAASANRADVDQASVDRIKDDPHVKNVLNLAQSLGLDSPDLVDRAIRQGAATETALIESRNRFYEFLNRFTERTDGPMPSFE